MEADALVAALLELAGNLGVAVRPMPAAMDSADGNGASLVRIKGKEVIFLNDDASAAEQAGGLAAALRGHKELEGMYLPPEVRQALEAAD